MHKNQGHLSSTIKPHKILWFSPPAMYALVQPTDQYSVMAHFILLYACLILINVKSWLQKASFTSFFHLLMFLFLFSHASSYSVSLPYSPSYIHISTSWSIILQLLPTFSFWLSHHTWCTHLTLQIILRHFISKAFVFFCILLYHCFALICPLESLLVGNRVVSFRNLLLSNHFFDCSTTSKLQEPHKLGLRIKGKNFVMHEICIYTYVYIYIHTHI